MTQFILGPPGSRSPPGLNMANPLSALEMTRLALFKMYNQAGLPHGGQNGPPGGPLGAAAGLNQVSLEMGRAMVEQQARVLQAAQREAEAREKELNSKSPSSDSIRFSQPKEDNNPINRPNNISNRPKENSEKSLSRNDEDDDLSPPPMKRERSDSFDQRNGSPIGMGANIRIANRGKNYTFLFIFNMFILGKFYGEEISLASFYNRCDEVFQSARMNRWR